MDNDYNPSMIRFDTFNMIIQTIVEEIIDKINLDNTDGFRWSLSFEQSFIESILLRVPLQPIYINHKIDDDITIVDGLKRLCALNSFIVKDEFAFDNSMYFPSLNGLTFSKLKRNVQRQIQETIIPIHRISKSVPNHVKTDLILRLGKKNEI